MTKDYLDPKQNPFIKIQQDDIPWPKDDGETLSEVLEPPIDLPDKNGKWPGEEGYGGEKKAASSSAPDPAGGDGRMEADNLERDILNVMADMTGGSYEIVVEDGAPTPLFNIIRTVNGKLEIKTPEGEIKDFSELTTLERKLIQHDLKTRGEFWGKRIG